MSKATNNSYSQNTTFALVLISAIVFACLGYWYGSTNPSGFSSMNIENLGLDNMIQGAPRDNPGRSSTDKASGDQIYENSRLNLSFHTPAGYYIKDGWTADTSDLTIWASSFEHLSAINTQNQTPAEQLEIIDYESINQLNTATLADIYNLDDFVSAYSKDFTDPSGSKQSAYFSGSEPTTIGSATGYKVSAVGDYATGNQYKQLYFLQDNGHIYQIAFRDSKDIDKLKDKVLATINFDYK